MKKFISGFLIGSILFGTIGIFAAQYVANPVDFKVIVNGKEFTSDPPALEVEGRTYLPLRAIGDALGVPVNWNEDLRQAEVGNSAPVAESNQYSRTNPAPVNTVQTYSKNYSYSPDDNYSVNIRVIEFLRGEQAYENLKKKSVLYPAPEDGYEYMNVKVAFSVIDTATDFSVLATGSNFDSYTANNEECPKNYYTSIDPSLTGNLYAGGNTEGWITVMVKKDDPNPKLVYGLDFDGKNGIWFALYE